MNNDLKNYFEKLHEKQKIENFNFAVTQDSETLKRLIKENELRVIPYNEMTGLLSNLVDFITNIWDVDCYPLRITVTESVLMDNEYLFRIKYCQQLLLTFHLNIINETEFRITLTNIGTTSFVICVNFNTKEKDFYKALREFFLMFF